MVKRNYNPNHFKNLLPIVILTMFFMTSMSFGCIMTVRKRDCCQSTLIKNTFSDSLVHSNQNERQGSKSQKNDIYKEKCKRSKTYRGKATYYHKGGLLTANGEAFKPYSKLTCAASPKFSFGTKLKIVNVANGKSVIVEVTDRGDFYKRKGHEYDLDLTHLAFSKIANHSHGVINIEYEILN